MLHYKEGVSFLGLSEAADSLGFRTLGVKIPFEMLADKMFLSVYCALGPEPFRCRLQDQEGKSLGSRSGDRARQIFPGRI